MHTWIDSADTLATWFGQHAAPASIGLDTEFMRTDTLRARLALLQVCVDGEVALIDPLGAGNPHALLKAVVDPNIVCVMHSAGEDLDVLAPMLPDGPANLFDTQIAAAMSGIGFGLSYQKLVSALLDVDLAKAETRSDWMRRPLSAAQLDYAAQDVAWLPQLQVLLACKLEELGRGEWLKQDCRALIERSRAPPDPQPQRTFRAAADWPIERQALLRRLLLWREATARALDKPKPWILDDAHALQLVSNPPKDLGELSERTRGLRALRGAQRQQLLEQLREPVGAADADIAPIPPALDSAQKNALAVMKTAVAAIAEQLQLPEGLLCSRRHLETLLTDRAWPSALEGWRKPLLFDTLMAKTP